MLESLNVPSMRVAIQAVNRRDGLHIGCRFGSPSRPSLHPDRVAQVSELQVTLGILWSASVVDRFASENVALQSR